MASNGTSRGGSDAEGLSLGGGKCSHCGSEALALVSKTPKPSWRDLFCRDRDTCPAWYEEIKKRCQEPGNQEKVSGTNGTAGCQIRS